MSSPLRVPKNAPRPNWVSTRNPCKACAPLGATLVMRGIAGALPFLHGSQGCATYMRRYIISHFREPMDIATSGFSEATTIFGGGANLHQGLGNVTSQYHPALIGIATTCLTETIGEDVHGLLHEYRAKRTGAGEPVLVHVATPAYSGTHVDGFHDAVRAVVEQLAEKDASPSAYASGFVNLFPGLVSAEDLRFLKEVAADFAMPLTLFPDCSETLDGPSMKKYEKIPEGGTTIAALRGTASAKASIEFGRTLRTKRTAASFLQERFEVPAKRIGMPIGVHESDAFFAVMEKLSGHETPEKYRQERGRLVDAYVDGHKYLFGKRAIVIGDEDLVVGLAANIAGSCRRPARVQPRVGRALCVFTRQQRAALSVACVELAAIQIEGNQRHFQLRLQPLHLCRARIGAAKRQPLPAAHRNRAVRRLRAGQHLPSTRNTQESHV